MLKLKRVYGDISQQDGKRILVDGVWSRGVKKDLKYDDWYEGIAPSAEMV